MFIIQWEFLLSLSCHVLRKKEGPVVGRKDICEWKITELKTYHTVSVIECIRNCSYVEMFCEIGFFKCYKNLFPFFFFFFLKGKVGRGREVWKLKYIDVYVTIICSFFSVCVYKSALLLKHFCYSLRKEAFPQLCSWINQQLCTCWRVWSFVLNKWSRSCFA